MVRDVMCCALVEVEWRARITANVTPYQVVINSCSIIILLYSVYIHVVFIRMTAY